MNILKKTLSSKLVFNSGVAIFDQALLSGINFIVSLFLIKYSSKLDYGYYSIGFPITLFLIAIQNAIVNTPLAVLLHGKKGKVRNQYAADLGYGQIIAVIPAVALGLTVMVLLKFWGFDPKKASVGIAICLAAIGLLFREYLRALFFAEESPGSVLRLDVLYTFLYLGSILIFYFFAQPGVSTVFILMGASGLLAGLFFNRNNDWSYNKDSIKESFRENWIYGRWSLFGVVVTHIQTYSFVYILGGLLGSIAVADVSAARLLMMPLILIQTGWVKVAVPHGSKLREEGKIHIFFREQVFSSICFVIGVALYVGILLGFSDFIQTYLLSEKYAQSFEYIFLWGILISIGFIILNASYGLIVLKRFDIGPKINFVTMILSVAGIFYSVQNFGIKGGLIAAIIGASILAILCWFYFIKIVFAVLVTQGNKESNLLKIFFAKHDIST